MPDEATPLTPALLDRMREHVRRVNEAVECRSNFPVGSDEYLAANLGVCRAIGDAHWIVSEHWKDLIATVDTITAERDDLKAKAERRRVIFDEALQHLKVEPVHLTLFTANVQLRERMADAREILARIEKQAAGMRGPTYDLLAQLRAVLG